MSHGSSHDSSDSIDDIRALITEKKRRLHQRELTAARFGISTPPEVSIEIEDLKRELADLQRRLEHKLADPQHAQESKKPPDPPQPSPARQVVLAAFAEPLGLSATEWEAEARVLRALLVPFEAQFSLREQPKATPEDLFQALLTIQPTILHFQGHGNEKGLLFEDTLGDRHPVPWSALMRTLTTCDSLTCVILNACDTYVHAQVGPQRFHLITTPGKMSTVAARTFTQGFYTALRANRTVPNAYHDGCNLLALKSIPEQEWPTITERAVST